MLLYTKEKKRKKEKEERKEKIKQEKDRQKEKVVCFQYTPVKRKTTPFQEEGTMVYKGNTNQNLTG